MGAIRLAVAAQPLQLEGIQVVDPKICAVAIKGNDQSKPYRRFRRSYDNYEKHEDLTIDISPVSRKRHESQVDGVEHELNAHENRNDVSTK
jgi:hypothetical protein